MVSNEWGLAGLEVPVDHPLGVDVHQTLEDLPQDPVGGLP